MLPVDATVQLMVLIILLTVTVVDCTILIMMATVGTMILLLSHALVQAVVTSAAEMIFKIQ